MIVYFYCNCMCAEGLCCVAVVVLISCFTQYFLSPNRYQQPNASLVQFQALDLSKVTKTCNGCSSRKYAFPGWSFSSLRQFSPQGCSLSVPIRHPFLPRQVVCHDLDSVPSKYQSVRN